MSRLGELMAEVAAERERFLKDSLAAFGKGVLQARTRKGLTQDDLADLIGLSRSSVANIEAGRQDTPISQAALIADVLDVSLADLASPETSI